MSAARKVETERFRDPDVPKGDINVNAVDGVVDLRGQVPEPTTDRSARRQSPQDPRRAGRRESAPSPQHAGANERVGRRRSSRGERCALPHGRRTWDPDDPAASRRSGYSRPPISRDFPCAADQDARGSTRADTRGDRRCVRKWPAPPGDKRQGGIRRPETFSGKGSGLRSRAVRKRPRCPWTAGQPCLWPLRVTVFPGR